MHKPESIRKNETYKFLWDYKIQTDHLFSVRKSDPVIIHKNKRNCHQVDFDDLGADQVKKKESKKTQKYLDLAKELKNLWYMTMTLMPLVNGPLRMLPKCFEKRMGGLEITGTI